MRWLSKLQIAVGTAALLSLSAAPAHAEPSPVRVQMLYEPSSLDPAKFDGAGEYRIAVDMFEGLVTLSPTGTPVAGVATSWETTPDGLVWTFHLRPDAKWSDGEPVTADDFVYAFRRVIDPATASPYIIALAPILRAAEISAGQEKDLSRLGVTAPDSQTLQITLAQPTPWFLALMTHHTGMPVPRKAIERFGDKWTQPEHIVTNGPYRMKRWIPLGEIDLVKNERFHDAASVLVPEVDYMLAEDSKAALKRYRAGELDVVEVPGPDIPQLMRERPSELRTYPLLATGYLTINMSGPLGRDVRIRQALSMVIDRDVLENQVIRRCQIPAYELVPPGIPGYTPQTVEWANKPISERVALARKLFSDAGVTGPLKIKLLNFKNDPYVLYGSAITQMWKTALGVDVEQDIVEARILEAQVTQHDFEMTIYNWFGDYIDPWTFLANFRADAQGLNPGNYHNPEFDALLDRSRLTTNPAERMGLMAAAEKLLMADQPMIPIRHPVTQTLVSPRLKGYENSPIPAHPSRYLSVTP
jgi:oligopeptide transport system substrate-binding protein